MGHDPGREYRAGTRPAIGELTGEYVDASRLRAATSAGSRTWQARCQGTRRSPGFAQCHIQTG